MILIVQNLIKTSSHHQRDEKRRIRVKKHGPDGLYTRWVSKLLGFIARNCHGAKLNEKLNKTQLLHNEFVLKKSHTETWKFNAEPSAENSMKTTRRPKRSNLLIRIDE